MKNFIKICKKEQYELKAWLEKLLKAKYKTVINKDGYLYAKGSEKCPILLTAHMDTVHKDRCSRIDIAKVDGKTVLSSPQGIGGDDRCGIWLIRMILTHTKYRPSILFCEDEEIGGVGSAKFADSDYVKDFENLKYLLELDRANSKDAVYYDCGNLDFKDYIEKTIGYKETWGSFSDIGHLSPACDKASVNLSCGYYKQHTLNEYVVFEEMFATYKVVKKLCADAKNCEAYDYQEERWASKYSKYNYGYTPRNYSWYDDYFDYEYEKQKSYYEINFKDEKGRDSYEYYEAYTFAEALGQWCQDYPDRCYNDIIDYYICDAQGLAI